MIQSDKTSVHATLSSWYHENMMPANGKNNTDYRVLYLDFIKLLAAYLTVFYHFAYYRLSYGFSVGVSYTPNFARIVMCIASACVPLFFMVNGVLILSKKRSIKELLKKIIKIIILVIFWKFTGFPSWFFKTLCVLYLLTPAFQFAYHKYRSLYYVFCIAIFLMPFAYNAMILMFNFLHIETLAVSSNIVIPVGALNRTGFYTLYSILYFLLGPILKNRKRSSPTGSVLLIGSGLLLVVVECTIYTNLNNSMFDGVNAAFPTLGALFLASGLFTLCQMCSFERIRKPLLFLSQEMLPIFLFHLFIINTLHVFPAHVCLWVALLVSFVILFLCVIVGKILSRIPVVCWFLKI